MARPTKYELLARRLAYYERHAELVRNLLKVVDAPGAHPGAIQATVAALYDKFGAEMARDHARRQPPRRRR